MIGYMLLLWLAAPAILLIVFFGLGVGLSILLGKRANFVLAIANGFLLSIVIGSLLSFSAITAPLSAYLIGSLGLAGTLLCAFSYREYFRFDKAASMAGLIAYFSYALPIAMSGKPGWAGWVKLDDTATWFAVTDRLMNVGQVVPGAISTTYDRVLQLYLGDGVFGSSGFNYPLGAYIPYGIMAKLTKIDVAWLFQPFMALVAGIVAMIFAMIIRSRVKNNFMIYIIPAISISASTLYSYVMWGGIKEIVLVLPLSLIGLILFQGFKRKSDIESLSYMLLSMFALFFIAGKSSIGFLVPLLIVAICIRLFNRSRKLFNSVVYTCAGFALLVLALFVSGNDVIGRVFVPPNGGDTGNLVRPLNFLQVMGIWPAPDFRMDPYFPALTYSIILIAMLFAGYGIYQSVKKSHWTMPALISSLILVITYSHFYGGIWFTAKAISVASPFFLLAASLGIWEAWLQVNSALEKRKALVNYPNLVVALGTLVGLGVVISNLLVYGNVWLAPYSEGNELRNIGKLYAGQGPTLMTEYSVFGARYFLRDMDTESASELRVHMIPLKDGTQLEKGWAADIGLFDNPTIDYFNYLVLRKSPVGSRPPQNYDLAWTGDYFQVWKKVNLSGAIKSTLGLGDNFSAGSVPDCKVVADFISTKAPTDKVYAVSREQVYKISFADVQLPANWTPIDAVSGAIYRQGTGSFSKFISVDRTGFYDLALAGSFPGRIKITIDASEVFSGSAYMEANPTLPNYLVKTSLTAGRHFVSVFYEEPWYLPGAFNASRIGPLYLSTQDAGQTQVREIKPSEFTKLCTRNLDWISIAG